MMTVLMDRVDTLNKIPAQGTALVYLGTNWCRFCKTTKPAMQELAAERPDIVFQEVDGDESPDIAEAVNLKTFPLILYFRDGKEVARRESGDVDTIRNWISEYEGQAVN